MLFGKLGASELILILIIVLVVFGPSRLPELGRSLGKGMRELKSHASKISGDITEDKTGE